MTFYEAWKIAEKEKEEARIRAKKCKEKNDPAFEIAYSWFKDREALADEMFIKYMEIEYKAELKNR